MSRRYRCESCNEDRFKNKKQFELHKELNHYKYKCQRCGCRFKTEDDLDNHFEDSTDLSCNVCGKSFYSDYALIQHQSAKDHSTAVCNACCESFHSHNALIQHRSANDHGTTYDSDADDVIRCPCGAEFSDDEDLEDHIEEKEEEYNFIPCLTCAQTFRNISSLDKHKEDTYHYKGAYDVWNIWQGLYAYFDAYFKEKVMVSRGDRKKSRVIVQEMILRIMKNVRKQAGGNLYKEKLQTAGSTSTQTKIGKADEFDFNIPLSSVDLANTETDGTINYSFEVSARTSLASHEKVVYNANGVDIPNGFSTVTSYTAMRLSYKRNLIPRWVQEDLHRKIAHSIEVLHISNNVSLQSSAHGPALTLIIKNEHTHTITVDISATIDVNDPTAEYYIPVSIHGWPRPDTKQCLSKDKIQAVLTSGVHLVPKNDLFWYISYSKAARKLLNVIDSWDECRRKCHMMLKKDFKTWQSESTHGFPGISTFIFKHHLFWMNERCYGRKKRYWRNANIGHCYADMLRDLSEHLRKKTLLNYFNTTENILEQKSKTVLMELANCMDCRRQELLHIIVLE